MIEKIKKSKMKQDNADGFSLIELMIAMVILSVGVLAIMSMQITTIKSNATARRTTMTASRGSDQLEKMMSMPFNDANLAPGTTTSQTDGFYTVEWTVSAPNTPIDNVKTITVTAYWMEAGMQRSTTYEYYKARKI